MNWQPLLDAGPIIQLHAGAAVLAIGLGVTQLAMPKGTPVHRAAGYAWVGIMAVVAISSFWIQELPGWRGFSWIHALSIVTLVTLVLAVRAARRTRVAAHAYAMIALFTGGLVIAGVFTLTPNRIIGRMLFGG